MNSEAIINLMPIRKSGETSESVLLTIVNVPPQMKVIESSINSAFRFLLNLTE